MVGSGRLRVAVASVGTADVVGTGKALLGVKVRKGRVVRTSDGTPTGSGVLVISVVGGRWVSTMLVGSFAGSVVFDSGKLVGRTVGVVEIT